MKHLLVTLSLVMVSACGSSSHELASTYVDDPLYYIGTWTADGTPNMYCSQDGSLCGASYQAGCGSNVAYQDMSGNSILGGTYVIDAGKNVTQAPTTDYAFTFTGPHMLISSGYQYDWLKLNNTTVVMVYTSTCAVKFLKQ